jgi:hypothetical protein
LRDLSNSSGVKIGFTRRDLRDAAVSIQIKFKVTNEELYDRLDNAVDIHRFVAANLGDRHLIQSYEELRGQIPNTIERHGKFLDLNISPGTITELADELSMKGRFSIYRMAFLPANDNKFDLRIILRKNTVQTVSQRRSRIECRNNYTNLGTLS